MALSDPRKGRRKGTSFLPSFPHPSSSSFTLPVSLFSFFFLETTRTLSQRKMLPQEGSRWDEGYATGAAAAAMDVDAGTRAMRRVEMKKGLPDRGEWQQKSSKK